MISGFSNYNSLGRHMPRGGTRTVYRDRVQFRDRVREVKVPGKCPKGGDHAAALAKARAKVARLEAIRAKLTANAEKMKAWAERKRAETRRMRATIDKQHAMLKARG